MEQNNEVQTSPNTDEMAELESLLGDEQAPSDEPQVDWEKQAKSAQKFLKELKDATGSKSVKEIKEKLAGQKPAPEPKKEEAATEASISVVDLLELRKQDFSEAEILDIHNEAKSLGVPIAKLLKNDLFKEGLERKREKAKVSQATPAPSQKVAPVFEGKKSFEELSEKERKANWSKAVAAVQRRGNNNNE